MSKAYGFLRDESGATAIEYAFIASGIFVAIVAVVQTIGTDLAGIFTNVQNGFK
jgi:pilus assembly protein Flp/PilA